MTGRPTILVVDDDPDILVLLEALLASEGFEAVSCQHPAAAAALAAERGATAVILDVMMPEMPGPEVLRALKEHPATRDVPVLMLSALSSGEDRVGGLKAGADDYLTKPFDPEELLIRLKRLVERARSSRSSTLEGELGRLAVGDVLQQVLAANLSGILEVGGEPAGWIEVTGGTVARAEVGGLKGESALLVLLDRRRGRFRFREAEVEAPADGRWLGLQSTLMRLAWLEDELERRRHLLPGAAEPLHAVPAQELPESQCERLPEVLDWIREHPGTTLGELGSGLGVAPQEAAVAVAMLREAGAVEAAAERGAPASPAEPELPGAAGVRPRLEVAARHLGELSGAMGRPPGLVHVLVAVSPDRWQGFVSEVLARVPEEVIERPLRVVLDELTERGSSTLRMQASGATLLLHCHRLAGLAGLRARAFMGLASAVVLAFSDASTGQAGEMARAVAEMERPPLAVAVPPQGDRAADVGLPPPWRLVTAVPEGLEELLELLGVLAAEQVAGGD